jgi:hypothetical protein
LYSQISKSHKEGKWPKDDGSETLKTANKHFGISRRSSQQAPATLGEEIFVGVLNAKILHLREQVAKDAKFLLDTSAGAASLWDVNKAPQEITLVEDFFKLGARARVKELLRLIVADQKEIAVHQEKAYIDFIEEQSKTWFVKP